MIEVQQLTKRFGRLTAVDQLSFAVQPGEAVALWGANGAGKTTALRCLLGLIPYDEGSITINSLDVQKAGKRVRRSIGFVPQELTFHDDLRLDETLYFYARLKKIKEVGPINQLVDRLQLKPHLTQNVGDLSGGLKQRLALVLALLNDPTVLFLDEPTASLDVYAREDFLNLLLELKHQGKTVIFSSHRLEEMSTLADRVLHLADGKLLADRTPLDLRQSMGWVSHLHLTLPKEAIEMALSIMGANGLESQPNGQGIYVSVPAGEKGTPFRLLAESGIPVTDFSIE